MNLYRQHSERVQINENNQISRLAKKAHYNSFSRYSTEIHSLSLLVIVISYNIFLTKNLRIM